MKYWEDDIIDIQFYSECLDIGGFWARGWAGSVGEGGLIGEGMCVVGTSGLEVFN